MLKPRALTPGQLIGDKYRFESMIAEGGMGVVLRATHVELGSPVAIKVVRPEFAANEDIVARLLSEARIAAALPHPHAERNVERRSRSCVRGSAGTGPACRTSFQGSTDPPSVVRRSVLAVLSPLVTWRSMALRRDVATRAWRRAEAPRRTSRARRTVRTPAPP